MLVFDKVKAYGKILLIIATIFLYACSPTPNNISMSINPGQCLTGGVDGAPLHNPAVGQYCMSVVLQNNNSGQNANNVQVISSGLSIGYTALSQSGWQSYSGIICDNIASGGVCGGNTNIVGNITIYDPNNCATQQGAHVTTLMANGGTCTFYLQIAAESFEIGSYPVNITYNYTNSNQNFSITSTVIQFVGLYSGGTYGMYLFSNGAWESADLTNEIVRVKSIIHDNYGNLYFNSQNSIYEYNGLLTNKLGADLPDSINSLTIDNNNNLIVGTQRGLYYYNVGSSTSWSPLIDKNGNISGDSTIFGVTYALESTQNENILYAIEQGASFMCLESVVTTLQISCSSISNSGPAQYYLNSLSSYNGVLYVGTTGGMESYYSSWNPYMLNPALGPGGYVSSIFANNTGIILGVINSLVNESSIYKCGLNTNCVSMASTTGNMVTGNIGSIVMDGAGYVYGIGNNINSLDFNNTITNANSVYESVVTTSGTTSSMWQPIGGAESLSALSVVSSLIN